MKKGRKSIGSSETFKEYDIFKVDKGLFIADSDKFPYIQDETNHIWAYANKWAEDKDVHLDESFDKNKGCKFEFDQEYVFVNLKHHRSYTQAGFQIIQKAHQPYDLQQISASSSNDENPKYDLPAVSLGVCTIQKVEKSWIYETFGRQGNFRLLVVQDLEKVLLLPLLYRHQNRSKE